MPETPAPIKQEERKYKDTESHIPYKDPYSSKEFYLASGSERNLKNPNIFFIDLDDNGAPVYGTYEKPEGKNAWDIDYMKQGVREYSDDNSTKVFPVSKNLDKVMMGQNPYQRKYLQDVPTDIYPNPETNQLIAGMKERYAPKEIAAVTPTLTPEQRGEAYINRLKGM